MKVLDRYLQSLSWLLPNTQKKDILAELSEDIRSEIEEKESGLGRKLNEAELEDILQRWGHPILVAERYLPQQYLIGPALFPIYRFVLKMVALCYLAPWLLVWMSLVIFDPAYRAANPGLAQIYNLQSFWLIAVHLFALITLGFALGERIQATSGALAKWSPRKLPPDPNRISRSDSIGEFVGNGAFLLWWLGALRFPPISGVTIGLAPIWRSVYWPTLLLLAASIAMAGVNTFRPCWTRRRSAIRLGIDSFSLILICFLLTAGPWVEFSVPSVPRATSGDVARWMNMNVWIILVGIGISLVLRAVQDTRRMRGKQPIRNWAVRIFAG